MEIHLLDDEKIRLTTRTAGFAFEAGEETALSPFHLLAASLATCTHSVLHGYAMAAGLSLDGLAIDVAWKLGDEPYRVTDVEMELDWPGLPPNRREAARRAAARCTIHHTLEHGSTVRTHVKETRAPGESE